MRSICPHPRTFAAAILLLTACPQDDSDEGGSEADQGTDSGGDVLVDTGIDTGECPSDYCEGQCLEDGWCIDRLAGGMLWVDVWGSAPDDLWVISQTAELVRFDGSVWTDSTIPARGLLGHIWGRGPDDVWVAGDQGEILHYDGNEWVDDSLGTLQDRVESFFSFGPDEPMYALGSTGTVYERGSEGGWSAIAMLGNSGTRQHLYGCDQTLYAATSGDVFGEEEGRWLRYGIGFGQGSIADAALFADGTMWVAADKLLTNEGAAWRWRTDELADQVVVGVAGTSPNDGWILTEEGEIWHFDGATWTENTGLGFSATVALYAPAPNQLFTGSSQGIIQWFDGSFPQIFVNKPASLSGETEDYWFASPTDVCQVGDDTLYCYHDGDPDWTQLDTVPAGTMIDMWGSSLDDIYIVNGTDDILHWDGETVSLVEHDLPITVDTVFKAVHGTGPDDVWVASPGRTLHFDGEAWSEMDSGNTRGSEDQTPVRLLARAPDDVWVMRSFNLFSHYNGESWRTEGFDDHEWVLGCASAGGGLVAVTTEPLEVRVGPPGLMDSGSEQIETYGVSTAWLGSEDDIWVLGNNATTPRILHFDGEWQPSLTDDQLALVSLWAFPTGEAVAVGYDVILRR